MEAKKRSELRDKHWSEILAEKVLGSKKPPFVVTGGITTSGPIHFGTVSEFLYPYTITEAIKQRGKEASFTFVGDIVDPFKSIPEIFKKYEKQLTPELGKPIAHVLDPLGCHKSYGEHFLSEAVDVMTMLGLRIKVVKSSELYESGGFDAYTRLYLKNEEKVRKVVAKSSLKSSEDMKDWNIIMPICAQDGKVSTTRVTWHNDEEYEYVCDKDVGYTKGCGYKGRAKISDHKYKLQWRLHWPTWHAHFGTSIEGAGADHIGKGKSSDTAAAVAKEILNRDPPIFYKFGLVLLHGKKYSKSKGMGMGIIELLKLIPPEVLKYALVVPNLEQNKEIDPTGERLIALFDEIERVEKLEKVENRADEKKAFAFKLAIKKLKWKATFLDVLLNYQIYRDWGRVGELLKDKEGVAYLAPYITEWLRRGFEPEQYNFAMKPQKISEHKELVSMFASELKPGMSDLDVHNLIYRVVDDDKAEAAKLFAATYRALIGKANGPRLGKLIAAIGTSKAKEMLANATK